MDLKPPKRWQPSHDGTGRAVKVPKSKATLPSFRKTIPTLTGMRSARSFRIRKDNLPEAMKTAVPYAGNSHAKQRLFEMDPEASHDRRPSRNLTPNGASHSLCSNLIALLAVVAAAGYQNRDKFAEVLQGLRGQRRPATDDANTLRQDCQRTAGS